MKETKECQCETNETKFNEEDGVDETLYGVDDDDMALIPILNVNPPGKRMDDFLRDKQIIAFMNELCKHVEGPVLTIEYGTSGTNAWMHRLLHLRYLSWFSPDIELSHYSYVKKQYQEMFGD